jgi:hypothetical protein
LTQDYHLLGISPASELSETPGKYPEDNNPLHQQHGESLKTKIFDPVKENGIQRIRTNQELMDLYREPDIISEIREGSL